jgi:hypothetical protein
MRAMLKITEFVNLINSLAARSFVQVMEVQALASRVGGAPFSTSSQTARNWR